MFAKKPLTEQVIDELRINLSVRNQKISPEPVCDFCGDFKPVCVYGAKVMSTGEMRNCWRWCACVRCAILVDTQQWEMLALRIAKMLSMVLPLDSELLHRSVKMCVDTFKNEVLEVKDDSH